MIYRMLKIGQSKIAKLLLASMVGLASLAGLAGVAQAQMAAPSDPAATPVPLAQPTAPNPAGAVGGQAGLPGTAGGTHQAPAPAKPFRIALLLPIRSDSLAQAANALKKGVLAAWERDADGVEVQTIETDDNLAEIVKAYQEAANEFDCIIGPLARSAVSALVQSGNIPKPTLVLGQSDSAALPENILSIGLSIEDEARQLAQRVASARSKILVIHTNAAWQRRAARAFLSQLSGTAPSGAAATQAAQVTQAAGSTGSTSEPGQIELLASSGYLSASSLTQLKAKIRSDKPNLVFLALTAEQTAQIRSLLPPEARIYATSQLYADSNPQPALDGIALLDLPWLVQLDHSAVMVYPRLDPGEARDSERLYALGIDALRIAREIGVARRTRFELDGVTGQLKIQFGKGPARFERQAIPVVYRAGLLQAAP